MSSQTTILWAILAEDINLPFHRASDFCMGMEDDGIG